MFFPFSGAGSEIIGFMKAGFDKELFECSELSPEYVEVAQKRIEYWEDVDMDAFIEKKVIKVEKPTIKPIDTDSILF